MHHHKRGPNTPASTPEHKSTWNCSYTHTMTPGLTFPAACTKLQTTVSLYWNHKNSGSEKACKCGNTGLLVAQVGTSRASNMLMEAKNHGSKICFNGATWDQLLKTLCKNG